jgi:hypothetical protein
VISAESHADSCCQLDLTQFATRVARPVNSPLVRSLSSV